MKRTHKFLMAVIFLGVAYLLASSALAYDPHEYWNGEHYKQDDPPEVISDSAINLEAGSDFDSAPLVAPGVYQGIMSTADNIGFDNTIETGKPNFFKVYLEEGQKITALLNTKREVAIDTEDSCANIEPFVAVFSPGGYLAAVQGSSRPIGGFDLNTEPWSISPRDNNLVHSNKAEYPFSNSYILGKKVVPEAAQKGDYIVVIGSSWFISCGNYSAEDIKNAPEYTSRRMNLEDEKKKYDKISYKLKISVDGSIEEYRKDLEAERAEREEYQIESQKKYQEEIDKDPVRKKRDEENKAMESYYENLVNSRGESDYLDEDDSDNSWAKNILVGLAMLVFLGGAVAAGVLFRRKKKMGNGEVVASNLDFSQSSSDIPNAQLCSICGDPITTEMAFCGKCGNKLK